RRAGARFPGGWLLHRRHRRFHSRKPARTGRRQPSRLARPAQALPLQGCVAGTRLRHAGGRQGRCRPRAFAPLDAQARALGAARAARGRRARNARDRPDAGGRGPRGPPRAQRAATPKLGAYAGLAALALLAGLSTRRPELVVIAAPFTLIAAMGLLSLRRPAIAVRCDVERERTLEDDEVGVTLALSATTGAERVEVLLELPHE